MAIVGDAYIVVKAITTGFESEVRRAASGIDLDREGRSVGDTFSRGFGRGIGSGLYQNLSAFDAAALNARKRFQSLVRVGYTVGPVLSVVLSTIGTLAAGLVSLASSLVAAAPSAIVFASALTSVGIAAIGLRAALSGVGKAISAGTKANLAGKKSTDAVEQATKRLLLATERVTEAQKDFTEAIKDAQEEIQQLGFDAEDAALAESKAAIELEKARETLQRVQDLPPNSRARREANLAFQEAELNLRRAKDRNSDLRKEQERLATAAVVAGTTQVEQTDTYLDAQKNLVDALRDQKDAQDEVNKAKTGGTADTSFQDALADLSKEAQGFVRYMVGTFIPSLKTLRDALGQQLFSQLESNLERLRTVLFPALRPVLVQLGDDIGKAFTKITDGIVNPENIVKLNKVIAQSGRSIQSYAGTLSNIYEAFLTLLVAAEPLINKFNKFIENKTAAFANYLNLQEASGELTKFFNKAGDIAASIGAIFGNTFSTISNITKANFAPGGGGYILIDWLKEVTGRWETFSGSVTGQTQLTQYFKDVAVNAKAVLSAVGAFTKELLKAGADPNIGEFFNILKTAAPSFGNLLKELNSGAPALAEFIKSLIKFGELTATSGAITAFFNVLTGLLNALNTFLAIPAVKTAFDFLSKIFATLSAAGLAFSAATFAFKVLAGNILFAVRAIGILIGKQTLATASTAGLTTKLRTLAISGVQGAIKGMGALAAAIGGSLLTSFKALGLVMRANPLGVLVTVLSLIAVGFATLYTKSEGFRNFIDGIAQKISSAFGGVINFLKTNWPMILAILTGPIGLAVLAISRNWDSIVAYARSIPGRMREALKNLWSGLTDGLKNAWSNAKAWWNANVASKKLKIGGATILGKTLPSFELGFPPLAKGGIVMPSPGGTIARIGEAGRPERVEPLDPDGLSRRDKAMIKLLAGGQGAGMTVNVYPSPGMDETELASLVSRQIAFSLRRGGA
jgi:hypothetical protein